MFLLYVVHGGYDDWSDWGTCSETCGEGQKTRSRSCNNPAPAHGGGDCDGAATESDTCNDGPCAGMYPDIDFDCLIYSKRNVNVLSGLRTLLTFPMDVFPCI